MLKAKVTKLHTLVLGAIAFTLLGSSEGAAANASHAAANAPARLPDWSGVWAPSGGFIFDPSAIGRPENKGRTGFEVRNFPPYNPEYEAKYDKDVAALRRGDGIIDPSAKCLPLGMPRVMIIGYPSEIIIQPKRVVMLFEVLSQRRIIYTDGRSHTAPADLDPTFQGESIGHWEGDVLVVDTIGIRGDLVFDNTGAPHSDALHITERIRRVSHDRMEDQMVLEDPKAFTGPWRVTRFWTLHPEWEIKEFVCENNRTPSGAPAPVG